MNYGFQISAAKRIGFIVSIGTLLYKLFVFFLLHDSILDKFIFGPRIYFSLYLTSIITVCSCVTAGKKVSKIIAYIMIPIHGLFLLFDGLLMLIGCAFKDEAFFTFTYGVHPVVNIFLIFANSYILKEILKEERMIRKQTNQVNVYPPGIIPDYDRMQNPQNMNQQASNPYGTETQGYGTTDADKEYRDKYGSDAFGG